MTAEVLQECKDLKKAMKKIKGMMKELPQYKNKYVEVEYKVREEFYRNQYIDWKISLKEKKKTLTVIERIKLGVYHARKEK